METNAIKTKKKPTKLEEMSKEQIRRAIIKKKECNSKAQEIVESLLEKSITEEYFLQCLYDINQSHLEDIIEERFIVHLCGYPLCSKTLSESEIPKQKYKISVKTNKVYDITARKSFCSNSCYKSAMFIKKQMLTSPLWFREYEDVPKFQLLLSDTVGSLGQEIDLSLTERLSIKSEKQTSFTSINDFTKASLTDIYPEKENKAIKENVVERLSTTENDQMKEQQPSEKTPSLAKEQTQEKNKELLNTKDVRKQSINQPIETKIIKPIKPIKNPLNIVGEIIEKPEKSIDPILTSGQSKSDVQHRMTKKTQQKKQPSVALITIEVEKCLAEWFTLDTMIFLLGEEKVKEMVNDKGECIKDYLKNYTKGIFYSSNSYDQYQALCRKLNMLELEDKKLDAQTQRETKPLPDYSILQEESKNLQLKVKAFFAGETEIETKVIDSESKEDLSNEENPTHIPLVDKNSQNALRRRIVCQHLNTVLPDLLRSLNLLTLSISSDVRLLVNTFKLRANNIMFKPIQWTLIAIIVIKLLSLRDGRLKYLLEQQIAFKHMQLLLLSYKQDGGYLERLISWLTDIDRLLNTNDTQLTIE